MKTITLPGGEHAVLALHGLLGNPLEMQYLGRRLQRAGYTVHIPLIVGYGFAAGTDATHEIHAYDQWYAEVVRHFELLQRTHATVSVTGLCIGAVLALRLAIERSDEISALSLLATTLAYDGWSLPWYRFLLPLAYHTPLRHVYSYQERHPYGFKNPRLQRLVAREMERTGASAAGRSRLSAEGIFQAHCLIREVRARLKAVRAPALMIHAQEDDVSTVRSTALVDSRISSPERRVVILQDSYHMVTLDNEKARVADETIQFFDRHLAARSRQDMAPAYAAS